MLRRYVEKGTSSFFLCLYIHWKLNTTICLGINTPTVTKEFPIDVKKLNMIMDVSSKQTQYPFKLHSHVENTLEYRDAHSPHTYTHISITTRFPNILICCYFIFGESRGYFCILDELSKKKWHLWCGRLLKYSYSSCE